MVDEVLVGRLQGGVLVAGNIDPGQGVAGHSGSRVRRQRMAVRECFTGTDSSHEFLLGGCERVDPGVCPPRVAQPAQRGCSLVSRPRGRGGEPLTAGAASTLTAHMFWRR